MDIEILSMEGGSFGKRRVPLPPRVGDTILLPQPFPDGERTMSEVDRASWSELQAYVVRNVIWDMIAASISIVVEETDRPEALR